MKNLSTLIIIFLLALTISCNQDEPSPGGLDTADILSKSGSESFSGDYSSGSSLGSSSGSSSNPDTVTNAGQEGLVTAGEWNDLENWDFWIDLLNGQTYFDKPDYWRFYTNNRISVQVVAGADPIVNAKVELKTNNQTIWTAQTDRKGMAELFPGIYSSDETVNLEELTIFINNERIETSLIRAEEGVNVIEHSAASSFSNKLELSFIVDATGSMSDELEFLKDDLESVIEQVATDNPTFEIYTSSVFYRDIGDEYVVKHSDFSQNIQVTQGFISQQYASGGGDYPEAVHTALRTGIEQLQWSEDAKTRIAFLLLDAPPHYEPQIVDEIHNSIMLAAEQGIKLIPITASGIDKETEFLMRFFSIATNGTYVFITDHSGIGNDHLEPSVGQYEVEYLNDLMVRLINKYTE